MNIKFKYTTILLLCFLMSAMNLFAQEKCGVTAIKEQKLQDPAVMQRVAEIEEFTQRWVKDYNENPSTRSSAVVTIPVVVHVLYENAVMNISDAKIISQIAVLNADFRKTNSDFSSTPTQFQGIAADTEIEFCLATVDPNGNQTNGITRKSVSAGFRYDANYYKPNDGGTAPWDNTKYLNVWLGNLLDDGLLGFATPPGFAEGDDDGTVIDYRVWGTLEPTEQDNHLGRTATHEIGHYFNLEHLWGATSGGCGEDDGVTDTPPQDGSSLGCPTFPQFDNCTGSGNGINYSNYMDYVDDPCMTMFTAGQKVRMLAAINGPRASLLSSNGCSGMTSASNIEKTQIAIKVFPNPAINYIGLEVDTEESMNMSLVDILGKRVLDFSVNGTATIDVSTLASGVYFLVADKQPNLAQKIVITK